MKYFIDTEFHECQKKPLFDKPIDTIELISIGIISEEIQTNNLNEAGDNFITELQGYNNNIPKGKYQKEYYAICKEFDLKSAWNNEWLRENILKPIWADLRYLEYKEPKETFGAASKMIMSASNRETFIKSMQLDKWFTYKDFKRLINKYGKTRKQIAEEIIEFIKPFKEEKDYECTCGFSECSNCITFEVYNEEADKNIEFYAYYADYDWVMFCSLWKEIYPVDNKKTGMSYIMPTGFPYYCKDLKQELDNYINLEKHSNYPKQTNKHNALAVAKWNKELYNFLNQL